MRGYVLPLRLELRNFMPYREPAPISFEGIAVACLAGDNGAGKSALLDAITWALWGKARAKRDEALIHHGQKDMRVQLDFIQAGQRYRVIRRRARAGRGSRGALDLLHWRGDAPPRLLNGDGMRRTQEKIEQVLRIDYDTFVHSSYLQQNRADAFTLKTPSERKRLLGEILGVARWADSESAVKAQIRQLDSQLAVLQHDIERNTEEMAQAPQLRSEQERLQAGADQARQQFQQAEARYQQLAQAESALRQAQFQQQQLRRDSASRQAALPAAQAECERNVQQVAGLRRIIAQASRIEAGYEQLRAARSQHSAIAEQLAQQQALERDIQPLQQSLAAQEAQLRQEVAILRERISSLRRQLQASPPDETRLQTQLRALNELDARRQQAVGIMQRQLQQRSSLETRLESLAADGQALNERLAQLAQVQGATCPLCGGELSASHRAELQAQFEAEREQLRAQYRSMTGELRGIDSAKQAHEQQLRVWAQQLQKLPALQQRAHTAAEERRKAASLRDDLQAAQAAQAQLELRLQAEDFAPELRAQLAQLQQARARLASDHGDFSDNKAQLESYAAYDSEHAQLQQARSRLPDAQQNLAASEARLAQLQRAKAADVQELQAIEARINALKSELEQSEAARAQLDDCRGRLQSLQARQAICAQELGALDAIAASQRGLQARLHAVSAERQLAEELCSAFGKDGLPAWLIASILPELEADANGLLARLSGGRLRLRLRTREPDASGGVSDRLALDIADELGERAYELYSGGEAFRVNFALRIALSKLLARRAGAELRALFIDEGFGSQDQGGREQLLAAIAAIQADFDLILVITHIEELRDAFPRRLLVEKTARGSVVSRF